MPQSEAIRAAMVSGDREQQDVITELTGIWKQENKESALLNLAAIIRQIPEALSRSRAQPRRR